MKNKKLINEYFNIIFSKRYGKYFLEDFLMRLFIASQLALSTSVYLDYMIENFSHNNYRNMIILTAAWLLFNIVFIVLRYKFNVKVNGDVFYQLQVDLRKDLLAKLMNNKNITVTDNENYYFSYFAYNIEDFVVMLFSFDKIIAYSIILVAVLIWSMTISVRLSLVIIVISFLYFIFSYLISKKENLINEDVFNKSSLLRNVHKNIYDGQCDYIANSIYDNQIDYFRNRIKDFYKAKNKLSTITSIKGNVENFIYIVTYILILLYSFMFSSGINIEKVIVLLTVYSVFHSLMNTLLKSVLTVVQKKYSVDQYMKLNETNIVKEKKDFTLPLEVKNLSYAIDSNKILHNINISIKEGQKVALIGKNGSGKSTLVNILLGNIKAYEGVVNINSDKFSYIAAKTQLFPVSIKENISYGIESEISNSYDEVIVNTSLAKINHDLDEELYDSEESLSGGEAERVSIVRALISDRELLIADEPTASLDKDTEEEVFNYIVKKSNTLFYITHNPLLVAKSDYVYILKDGTIVREGDYSKIKESLEYKEWCLES